MSVHTIFVPKGWSVEQAWEAIQRGENVEGLAGGSKGDSMIGTWVNVDDDGKVVK